METDDTFKKTKVMLDLLNQDQLYRIKFFAMSKSTDKIALDICDYVATRAKMPLSDIWQAADLLVKNPHIIEIDLDITLPKGW